MYPPEPSEPTREPSYTTHKWKQRERGLAYRGAMLLSRPPTRTAKESGRRGSRAERASKRGNRGGGGGSGGEGVESERENTRESDEKKGGQGDTHGGGSRRAAAGAEGGKPGRVWNSVGGLGEWRRGQGQTGVGIGSSGQRSHAAATPTCLPGWHWRSEQAPGLSP